MDESNISVADWKCWCRLCAKIGAKKINMLPEKSHRSLGSDNSNNGHLVDFIKEFFRINMRDDKELPHLICTHCVDLLTELLKFVEHVKQVQTMYDTIRLTGEWKPIDLRILRNKCILHENDIYTLKILPPTPKQQHGCNTKSSIEKVFVADVTKDVAQNTLDSLVKSELISDEVQSDFLGNMEMEHKKEFDDPIGDGDENIFSEKESCKQSELMRNLNKALDMDLTETNSKAIEKGLRKKLKKKYQGFDVAPAEAPKYFCASCSLHFHRIGNFRVHMKKAHERDQESLTCPQCSKSFKSKFKLNRHIQTHRPPEEKKIFPCPQCEGKFQTKDYVTKHIKFVHEDVRPFICEECGEAVRTETTLREHMLIHTDYAPFECDVCKKGFKNQYRLKNHKEMHSSDKHICTECGLQLNSRVTLNRHMLVHSDVMRHKCDYCGRAFKRAKTLKNHLILHSGLKPYSCDFCERTFATGANCRTHKRKTHPEELAALEAAGCKAYTKNIPKLSVLKTVTRCAENLHPVVSKQSGNFSRSKRPKPPPTLSADDTKSSKLFEQSIADVVSPPSKVEEPADTIPTKSQTSFKEQNLEPAHLTELDNIPPPTFWKY
ncbi:zinc finger protein weckle-like [Eurosta solidaginis]|uniref:zinc finger protein weckle-like n=1 Tax=Eurosta solidaginis TaxID=178769 RepID=UPI003530C87B